MKKSKITRLKPEEVASMKFKQVKLILKKDFENLASLGEEAEHAQFYLQTDFEYADGKGKKKPLLVISDFKGEWKKFVKDSVKPPHKTTVSGTCFLSGDKKTITLNIEKGKAKPTAIKSALKTSKLLPDGIKPVFKETPKPDADEAITAVDDAEDTGEDKTFAKILEAAKVYKGIDLEDGKARLKQIKKINRGIKSWQRKNLPIQDGDQEGAKRADQIAKLKSQLDSHEMDIYVRGRKTCESIDEIKEAWEKYQKRPTVTGVDELADVEDRTDTIVDLSEEIKAWFGRNPEPLSRKERKVKEKLAVIRTEISEESVRLCNALAIARQNYVKAMFEQIKNADPKELEQLKKDEIFMWELSRTVPTAQINDARKLMGLPPIKEEEGDAIDKNPREEWSDPAIQELFKDFSKFSKFEVAIDHREDPAFIKQVRVPANTQIWEESVGVAGIFPLGEDFDFELISEDGKGNYRLKAGDDYYYAPKNSITGETHYEKLKADTALFPVPPSKNHIKQGGLGDCYLLSAITSLVDKDPSFIEDMMMDKGDTVTVRLFHVEVDAKKKRKYTARYFNIDKSIVKDPGNDDAYTHDYLWVQMLEKAYAAGSFTGDYDTYNDKMKGTYKNIADGYIGFSYEVLTGKPSEMLFYNLVSQEDYAPMGMTATERGKPSVTSVDLQTLPWCTAEKALFSGKKYKKSMIYSLVGNDAALTAKWKIFVQKGSITKLFAREFSADYQGQVTIDDFEKLFKGEMKDANDDPVAGLPKLDATVAKAVLDWLKKEQIYPGKRGAGIYSKLQLSLFKEIADALTNNKLVGLGTKGNVGRDTDGVGHSGGEAISGGLVGGHAYTVLETRENAPLKELEIRNPWGQTVQKNITVQDRIVEVEALLTKILKIEIKAIREGAQEFRKKAIEFKGRMEAEVDEAEKELLKEQSEALFKQYHKIIKRALDMSKAENLLNYKDKLDGQKENYNKALALVLKLKKKDPNALISKELKKSDEAKQEEGEFWLLLDDLTHRFSSIHIG